MTTRLGIATRFYGSSPSDLPRLAAWLDAARVVVAPEDIFVAVRAEEDASGALVYLAAEHPSVNAFPVVPWGRVVQAPNALLIKSAPRVDQLLYASTEYPLTQPLIERLVAALDANTLVVGAALHGHALRARPGEQVLVGQAGGLEIPWNTLAVWSVSHLIHTGFVLTADSFDDPDNAGMEEMGTIAAQQRLWPGRAQAKLVAPAQGELVHNTHGWTIERQERFARNLASKAARSQAQIERLALPHPSVLHIG